ncbi:MAG: PKD domain-containing protein [Bacteroidota bacterium]
MKRFPIFLLSLLAASFLSAQPTLYVDDYFPQAGNPGGINQELDFQTAGWTYLNGDYCYGPNSWSDSLPLPFPFVFFGDTVTALKLTPNGLLTFDVHAPWNPAFNSPLPASDPQLPDQTISALHVPYIIFADDLPHYKVFGQPGNQQLWIRSISHNYDICVLEEGTNTIYFVNQLGGSWAYPPNGSLGVRKNDSTFQDFFIYNLPISSPWSSSPTDNSYVRIQEEVFTRDLAVSQVAAAPSPLRGREFTQHSLGSAIAFEAYLKNVGPDTVLQTTVSLALNGTTLATNNLAQALPPEDSVFFPFAQTLDASLPGAYTVQIFVDDSLDQISANDGENLPFVQHPNPPLVFPYSLSIPSWTYSFNQPWQDSVIGIPSLERFDYFPHPDGSGKLISAVGGYPNGDSKALVLSGEGGSGPDHLIDTYNLAEFDTTLFLGLSFFLRRHFQPFQPADGLWARGSDSDPWVLLMRFDSLGLNSWESLLFQNIALKDLLFAAGQNFSSSTQLRFSVQSTEQIAGFGQNQGGGYTIDDLVLTQGFYKDLELDLLTPYLNSELCGTDSVLWRLWLRNKGIEALEADSLQVSLYQATQLVHQDTIPFAGLEIEQNISIFLPPYDFRVGGDFRVEVTHLLSGDQFAANDTAIGLRHYYPAIPPALAAPASVCVGESATLQAVPYFGADQVAWYSDWHWDSVLFTGSAFETPPLTQNQTYYLAPSTRYTLGAPDTSIGNGTFEPIGQQGMELQMANPVILDSLTVYPQQAGDLHLNLRHSPGASIISTRIIPVVPGPDGSARVGVDLSLGTGVFVLDVAGSTVGGLFTSQAGAAFPYEQIGLMRLSRSWPDPTTSSQEQVLFYDVLINGRGFPCGIPFLPVEVSVFDSLPSANFEFTPTGLLIDFVSTATDAFQISYDFGDGTTSDEANPTHTYAQSGEYEVRQIVENGCGADTLPQLIRVFLTSRAEELQQAWQVFPNPASQFVESRLDLSIGATVAGQLLNPQGQIVWQQAPHNYAGQVKWRIPVQKLARGIYVLQLQVGEQMLTRKVAVR